MVLGNVIDFRDRVEDEDCPEQLLKYSVKVPIDADVVSYIILYDQIGILIHIQNIYIYNCLPSLNYFQYVFCRKCHSFRQLIKMPIC